MPVLWQLQDIAMEGVFVSLSFIPTLAKAKEEQCGSLSFVPGQTLSPNETRFFWKLVFDSLCAAADKHWPSQKSREGSLEAVGTCHNCCFLFNAVCGYSDFMFFTSCKPRPFPECVMVSVHVFCFQKAAGVYCMFMALQSYTEHRTIQLFESEGTLKIN